MFDKREAVCWHSFEYILARRVCSDMEKCLVLCGVLAGSWGMEAFVCLGRRRGEGSFFWWSWLCAVFFTIRERSGFHI